MVKIKLDEEWSINDHGSHYELLKYTGKTQEIKEKNGNVRVNQIYDHQSYPPTLMRGIQAYVRRKVADSEEVVSLTQYVDKIEALYLKILADLNSRGILG